MRAASAADIKVSLQKEINKPPGESIIKRTPSSAATRNDRQLVYSSKRRKFQKNHGLLNTETTHNAYIEEPTVDGLAPDEGFISTENINSINLNKMLEGYLSKKPSPKKASPPKRSPIYSPPA